MQSLPITPAAQGLSRNERRLAKKNKAKGVKGSTPVAHDVGVAIQQAQHADAAGQTDIAKDLFVKLINTYKNEATAHFCAGVFFQNHEFDSLAYTAFKNAVTLEPSKSIHWVGLAVILKRASQLEAAIIAFEHAIKLDEHNPSLWSNLAKVYRAHNNPQSALSAIDNALSLQPNNAEYHSIRAEVLRVLGKFEQAREEFYKTVELDPGKIDAYFSLLQTDAKIENADEILLKFKKELASLDPEDKSVSLYLFSIAKLEEQQTNYDESIQYYIRANRHDFDRGDYDLKQDLERFENYKRAFNAETIAGLPQTGTNSDVPVFIIGMPRSGTTLVEQVITRHSQATGAGELNKVGLMTGDLVSASAPDCVYPENISKLNPAIFTELSEAYLAYLYRQTPGEWRRIVDKMPHNFMFIGFIKLLFPEATIIHCKRNALDTCLSNFMVRFPSMQQMGFSYDLEALGKFYKGYERLMAHWHQVFPGQILDVEYENMVTNQEVVSREIIQHIGLDWEEDCLDFHKNTGGVQTASAWQVRQPLYSSSIDRWKRYERYLGPLQKALKIG